MKKINLKNTKEELQKYSPDNSMLELILNNIELYNDLIRKYKAGEKVNVYTIYQLNVQLTKQLELIRKSNKSSTGEEDKFDELLSSIKNN